MPSRKETELAINQLLLKQNRYPGRGIVIGLDSPGRNIVQIYWIMGRSENSRNRLFGYEAETGRLFTRVADPSKVSDASLVIYNAMRENNGFYVVSNGHQTDDIYEAVCDGRSFFEAVLQQWPEPDAPHHTPRISAICQLGSDIGAIAKMSIVSKSLIDDNCTYHSYPFNELRPGIGHCLTTYANDGDPLPTFRGDPYLLPLEGDINTITETFWNALCAENRVAVAVKFVNVATGKSQIKIVNRFAPVS